MSVEIQPPDIPALTETAATEVDVVTLPPDTLSDAPPENTTVFVVPVSGPRGPAGTPGADGADGAPGGTVYIFTQSDPSASWIINHNLGRKVHTTVFDDDGQVVWPDIEHGTPNQTTITSAEPFSGSAVLS